MRKKNTQKHRKIFGEFNFSPYLCRRINNYLKKGDDNLCQKEH